MTVEVEETAQIITVMSFRRVKTYVKLYLSSFFFLILRWKSWWILPQTVTCPLLVTCPGKGVVGNKRDGGRSLPVKIKCYYLSLQPDSGGETELSEGWTSLSLLFMFQNKTKTSQKVPVLFVDNIKSCLKFSSSYLSVWVHEEFP